MVIDSRKHKAKNHEVRSYPHTTQQIVSVVPQTSRNTPEIKPLSITRLTRDIATKLKNHPRLLRVASTVTNDMKDVLLASNLLKSRGDVNTQFDLSYPELNFIRNTRETFFRGTIVIVQDVLNDMNHDDSVYGIRALKRMRLSLKTKGMSIRQTVRLTVNKRNPKPSPL